MWNNWKTIKKGDYLYAKIPTHPNASKNGYVLEHRVVVENKIGRLLRENEEVHHIDGNKHNNSQENLEVMLRGEHQRMHSTKYKDGHILTFRCANCGKEFKRKYNQRPEVKKYKLSFCSKRCSGKFYNK